MLHAPQQWIEPSYIPLYTLLSELLLDLQSLIPYIFELRVTEEQLIIL
jgi:hypothetical protein